MIFQITREVTKQEIANSDEKFYNNPWGTQGGGNKQGKIKKISRTKKLNTEA